MALYNIHSIKLGDKIISSIASTSEDSGMEVTKDPLDGELFPPMPVITSHNPTVPFVTHDLSLLDILGSIGTSMSEYEGGLTIYYKKRKPEGFFYPNDEPVHRARTTTQGILAPMSLSWSHNTPAQLQCQIFVSQDGVNDAWILNDSSQLPTIGTPRLYSFGRARIAGKLLTSVNQCNVNFGINVVGDDSDGDLSDKIKYYDQVVPDLTLSGRDLDWLSSEGLPENFAALHEDTEVWFRQWINEGKYYPKTTANSIKLTMAGLGRFTTTEGSGGSPATTTLFIDGRRDGDNMPFMVENNVALEE